MSYCTESSLDGYLSIAIVKLPKNLSGRYQRLVTTTASRYSGCVLPIEFSDDGSVIIKVRFDDNNSAKMFCKTINETIEKEVSPEDTPGEDSFWENLSSYQAFPYDVRQVLQDLALFTYKIMPAIQFVTDNGGWYDPNCGKSKGIDTLVDNLHTDKLSREIKNATALMTSLMTSLMAVYKFYEENGSKYLTNF